ncbi:MAG: YtxH domain-containing protein [Bacteroidota bacterium]
MSNQTSSPNGLLGFLLGGLVGVGVGLLVAPERGQDVRRRMAYHVSALSNRIAELVEQMNRIEADSEARRQGEEIVAEATQRAEQIMQDANELLARLRRGEAA